MLSKLSVPRRPANLDEVGQGPIALAAGAGGVVWTFFLLSIISLFFLPLRVQTEILSQRAVNPKTTDQINQLFSSSSISDVLMLIYAC